MPPGNGNGGGKPGGGGGSSTPFVIDGLDFDSDETAPGDNTTTLQTGFVITGTIDQAIVDDPNFVSLTVIINGDPYTLYRDDISGGFWSVTYDGEAIEPGTVEVTAFYTSNHPKNGKPQNKSADNTYTFTIEEAPNNPATISGDITDSVTEDSGVDASGLLAA